MENILAVTGLTEPQQKYLDETFDAATAAANRYGIGIFSARALLLEALIAVASNATANQDASHVAPPGP